MPILVRNVRLGLDEAEETLRDAAASRLRVPAASIRTFAIVRRSLDARKRDDIHFRYQVEVELDESHKAQKARLQRLRRGDVSWLEPSSPEDPVCGGEVLVCRPIVVGFGPGGMFAAVRLAELGFRPIVLERGRDVRRRHRDVMQRFYRDREFDPTSNVLFGEGGAGTYSDGKLYTRVSDPLCRVVLETLYRNGADPDILLDARPHIGSDRLPTICARIRQSIEEMGGEVRFECQVDDIRAVDGRLEAIHVSGVGAEALADSGQMEPGESSDGVWLSAGPTLLAVGQSARDTVRMLHRRGAQIEPKPFQIGVRIEHPQALVNEWQYGTAAGHRRLGAAEYHVVAKRAAADHGDVFSFCMCPGGQILPANEAAGLIATNGASPSHRSSPFANSGLVLTIDPSLLVSSKTGNLALDSLDFLEQWERAAFEMTGGSYRVPAQRASDYLADRGSDGTLDISYPLGGAWARIKSLIPAPVHEALRRALPMLDKRYPGFAGGDGLITGPETRASSPVRIVRDPTSREAVDLANFYPVGEGAGYAGGIVSAAVDGIKSADVIIRRYAPLR